MANFTEVMTGTNEISEEVLVALNGSFQIANAQFSILPRLAIRSLASDANQLEFSFSRVTEIDSSVSAELNEYEDPDSVPLAAEKTKITAKEYGRVVTTTSLADVISGGALGRQAAAAVGRDAARWENGLVAATLGAGTNALFAGTAGTSAGLTAGDVMTPQLMNIAYNRLSKAGATKNAAGYYNAILHPDQILDLKNEVGEGSWTDVFKYSDPTTVMRGEVARAFGFSIIESPLLGSANQSGGPVDVYKAVFFGNDSLGAGINLGPRLGVTVGGKIARFASYSWYAVLVYGIIDQNQVFVVNTSSSLGVNA